MSGREDYEERRQARIDRLNEAASKAASVATAQHQRSHDLVKDIPFGQPNIIGRPALPNLRKKSISALERAVEASDKAEYYTDRAEAAESNNAISSDDPEAVTKLEEKLKRLEAQRESIKAENKKAKKEGKDTEPTWMLANLGATINATKKRIEQIKRVDAMPDEIIPFDGGEIISDAETNRIQIKFDERQGDDVTDTLKRNGFHWASSEGAWQRLRGRYALYAAKQICGLIKGD